MAHLAASRCQNGLGKNEEWQRLQKFLDSLPPLPATASSTSSGRGARRVGLATSSVLAEHPWLLDFLERHGANLRPGKPNDEGSVGAHST